MKTHEMVLNERPGRTHHCYVKGQGVIGKLNNCLVHAIKEPTRHVFQLPNFMLEAETPIQVWKRGGDVAQIIFGSFSAADRLILS